jgi:hypothetical protein
MVYIIYVFKGLTEHEMSSGKWENNATPRGRSSRPNTLPISPKVDLAYGCPELTPNLHQV